MQDALAKKDRLFTGFIQPGILVTEYLLNRGRAREAYHQIIQTVSFCSLFPAIHPKPLTNMFKFQV
jgi:hypothetical protein